VRSAQRTPLDRNHDEPTHPQKADGPVGGGRAHRIGGTPLTGEDVTGVDAAVQPAASGPCTCSSFVRRLALSHAQVSFFIVVSSSSAYAEHLGGNATFSGVVIGIPTVFAGLALIPMMRYDGGGYRRPLHGICASAILGHVIYALAYRANFLYLILLGRMVNGLAFTGFMYTKRPDTSLLACRVLSLTCCTPDIVQMLVSLVCGDVQRWPVSSSLVRVWA
jgi:hypothetical protein